AGRGVAEVAQRMLGSLRGHVAVVCGPGNNGGDGFVVTRVLRDRGVDAVAYLAAGREAIEGDALAHLEILERSGGVIRSIAAPAELAEVGEALSSAVLAIDALFGLGPLRAIKGHLADVIAQINAARWRLAVDLPSGLDADTGRVDGAVVDAHRTASMGARKIALVSAPGFARCGEIEVVDIGIPPALIVTANVRAGLVEESDVARWLPKPGPMDHKGTRGHVLVIGGAPEMRGAGRLAAAAALRAGAGLVTLAGDGDVTAADSVMTRSITDDLSAALEGKSAVVIGPGLGTGEVAAQRVADVLAAGAPAVLDADALNVLASDPAAIARATGPVVITPHPGEAGRLLGITTAAVEADRLSAARALALATRAVVVLKGARTIIVDGTIGDEHCSINPTGGPALATAGSGDVLAGVIAALLAQGVAAGDAARAGAYVHGRAGEALEAVHGRGAMSSDLAVAIAAAIRQLAR
nr:NAD(P)H-hydrate dehydratase [Deltaproteobacteria bacterium]